jgi:hypothetical protein
LGTSNKTEPDASGSREPLFGPEVKKASWRLPVVESPSRRKFHEKGGKKKRRKISLPAFCANWIGALVRSVMGSSAIRTRLEYLFERVEQMADHVR